MQSRLECNDQMYESAAVSLRSMLARGLKVLTGKTFKEYIERSFHGSKQRDDSAREGANSNVKGTPADSVKA